MPTFENRESLSSVRQKLNDAILLAEATSVDLEIEKGLAQLAATQAQGYANAAQAAATAAEAVEFDANAAIAAAGQAAISAAEASASATGAAASANTSSTKALEAAASATLANTLATQAGTSASSANTSASQAANSANLAEGYMTGAGGYSGNASNQAVIATNQASIATAQASLASTKASEASNSATQSANSTLAASSFAETAATQAGISTTKAGEAASSAITASTQASISTSKASEAASSALAAEAARDQASIVISTFGPGMVLHQVDETIPTGWWDTGLRQTATSELWGNTATLALISNWSTASLYTGGIATAWFDFTTASREFQDLLGTAVTTPGQSVGMVRDAISPLTFGPELVVNGDFATDTVWSKGSGWTISGGAANKAAGGAGLLGQAITLTAGQTYRVKFDVTLSDGVITPRFTGGPVVSGTAIFASGSYTQYLTAAAGNNLLVFGADSTFAGSIDNVSVQEVLGVVATQGSASLRGRWASWPVTGRRNLSANSEPTVAQLSASGGVSNAVVAISGFSNSIQFVDNAAGRFAYVAAQSGAWVQGATATVSFFVQMDDGGVPVAGTSASGQPGADFVVIVGGAAAASPTVTLIGGGVYRVSGSVALGAALNSNGAVKYVTNSTRGFRVSGFQLELGSAATAYQRVNSADDITQSGVRNAGMWRPDLVDDALTFNLPAAADGELILMGRDGSWREPRPASAGTAVTIGGTGAGTLATPGILRATGPLVAMGFRQGTMTADEWLRLKRRWRSEGARGELILGPELILNGTFDSDVSAWTAFGDGTISWQLGAMRLLNNTPFTASASPLAQQGISTVAGAAYLATLTLVGASVAPGLIGVSVGSGTTNSALGKRGLGGVAGVYRLAFVASSATTFIKLMSDTKTAGAWCDFDNVSVRALTPEY